MPKMGGLELFHAIQDRWPDIKMLFVTGQPMDAKTKNYSKKAMFIAAKTVFGAGIQSCVAKFIES
jgi:CheY-like chemotaxis protein